MVGRPSKGLLIVRHPAGVDDSIKHVNASRASGCSGRADAREASRCELLPVNRIALRSQLGSPCRQLLRRDVDILNAWVSDVASQRQVRPPGQTATYRGRVMVETVYGSAKRFRTKTVDRADERPDASCMPLAGLTAADRSGAVGIGNARLFICFATLLLIPEACA